jgi:hypothetical protein
MFRAGGYLVLVENKINAVFPGESKALSWENWLVSDQGHGKTPHHKLHLHYHSVVLLLSVTAAVSVCLGNFKLNQSTTNLALLVTDALETAALLVAVRLSYGMIRSCQTYCRKRPANQAL